MFLIFTSFIYLFIYLFFIGSLDSNYSCSLRFNILVKTSHHSSVIKMLKNILTTLKTFKHTPTVDVHCKNTPILNGSDGKSMLHASAK